MIRWINWELLSACCLATSWYSLEKEWLLRETVGLGNRRIMYMCFNTLPSMSGARRNLRKAVWSSVSRISLIILLSSPHPFSPSALAKSCMSNINKLKWGLLSWLNDVGNTVLWYQLEGGWKSRRRFNGMLWPSSGQRRREYHAGNRELCILHNKLGHTFVGRHWGNDQVLFHSHPASRLGPLNTWNLAATLPPPFPRLNLQIQHKEYSTYVHAGSNAARKLRKATEELNLEHAQMK